MFFGQQCLLTAKSICANIDAVQKRIVGPLKTNLIYWARAGFGNTLGKLVQTNYFCTPLEN